MKYWPLVFLMINGLFLWVSWSFKKGIPTHDDLKGVVESVDHLRDEMERRSKKQDERILIVERDLKHAPNDDDLKELHQKINAIATVVGEANGTLSGLQRSVDLMTEHLINRGLK
jgi:hypothetical protein